MSLLYIDLISLNKHMFEQSFVQVWITTLFSYFQFFFLMFDYFTWKHIVSIKIWCQKDSNSQTASSVMLQGKQTPHCQKRLSFRLFLWILFQFFRRAWKMFLSHFSEQNPKVLNVHSPLMTQNLNNSKGTKSNYH